MSGMAFARSGSPRRVVRTVIRRLGVGLVAASLVGVVTLFTAPAVFAQDDDVVDVDASDVVDVNDNRGSVVDRVFDDVVGEATFDDVFGGTLF